MPSGEHPLNTSVGLLVWIWLCLHIKHSLRAEAFTMDDSSCSFATVSGFACVFRAERVSPVVSVCVCYTYTYNTDRALQLYLPAVSLRTPGLALSGVFDMNHRCSSFLLLTQRVFIGTIVMNCFCSREVVSGSFCNEVAATKFTDMKSQMCRLNTKHSFTFIPYPPKNPENLKL